MVPASLTRKGAPTTVSSRTKWPVDVHHETKQVRDEALTKKLTEKCERPRGLLDQCINPITCGVLAATLTLYPNTMWRSRSARNLRTVERRERQGSNICKDWSGARAARGTAGPGQKTREGDAAALASGRAGCGRGVRLEPAGVDEGGGDGGGGGAPPRAPAGTAQKNQSRRVEAGN